MTLSTYLPVIVVGIFVALRPANRSQPLKMTRLHTRPAACVLVLGFAIIATQPAAAEFDQAHATFRKFALVENARQRLPGRRVANGVSKLAAFRMQKFPCCLKSCFFAQVHGAHAQRTRSLAPLSRCTRRRGSAVFAQLALSAHRLLHEQMRPRAQRPRLPGTGVAWEHAVNG